jgi:hypothetical protein
MATGTMKNQQNPRIWHVGEDDVGRPVLLWDADASGNAEATCDEHDPLAQTFNFLNRLDVPNLQLEGEPNDDSRDPYDSDG